MDPSIPQSASRYLETPNMERLAERGMRFASGYSPAPLCTPTRRSILCGMTPARQHGTRFASEFDWQGVLTIPKALKMADANYRSAHFGKFGAKMGTTPDEAGFDESDGVTTNSTGGMPFPFAQRSQTVVREDPKLIFSLTRRAIDFMERQVQEGAPFYIQVSHYAPHIQVQTERASIEKYRRKGKPDRAITHGFAGMLDDLDRGVGQLLDAVDRLEISDNTYLILMGDNGGRDPIPGANQSLSPPNRPLSGAKHSLWEGGIRVPFMVAGPGVRPDSVSHVPVTGYDLLPTLYDLAGGGKTLPSEIDGGSFRGILESGGDGQVHRALDGIVFHRPFRKVAPQSTIRVGDYKLLIRWRRPGSPHQSLLFNLKDDLSEQNDLAAAMPDKAAELEGKLLRYLRDVNAEMPDGVPLPIR